ncbi:hypothetical protein BDQ17DRAFT_1542091 [Cyathus striatus]|nr:hypothetical protein BDQ17DRAFT_1542091 [Cyathus striatus]
MPPKKKATQETFSSLFLKLKNGGRQQRVEWMANLPKEYATCYECKKSTQYKCDQQLVTCHSCERRGLQCPRLAHFIRDTIMETLSISRATYIEFLKRYNAQSSGELLPSVDPYNPPIQTYDLKLDTPEPPRASSSQITLVPSDRDHEVERAVEPIAEENAQEDDDTLEHDFGLFHSRLVRRIKSTSELKKQLRVKEKMLADAQNLSNEMQQRLDDTELSLKRALTGNIDAEAALKRRFQSVLESMFASSTHTNAIHILAQKLKTDIKNRKLNVQVRRNGPDDLLDRVEEIETELQDLAEFYFKSQSEREEYLSWLKRIAVAHAMGERGKKRKRDTVDLTDAEDDQASTSALSGKRKKVRKSKRHQSCS